MNEISNMHIFFVIVINQDPMFWYYFIGPAMIFAVDKTVSLARQKREIKVIDAELLPSGKGRLKRSRSLMPNSFPQVNVV